MALNGKREELVRVLVIGASGTIGRMVAAALAAAGHTVIGTSRDRAAAFAAQPEYGWIQADPVHDVEERLWWPRLYAIDAVVQCLRVGSVAGEASERGLRALRDACERNAVRRLVDVSEGGDAVLALLETASEPVA
jgi:nucleoside-diphosphate-sugar epimerase